MTKKLLTIICMAVMLTACSNADSSTAVTTPAGQTTTTTTTQSEATTTTTESEPVEELTTTTTTSEEQSVTTTTTTTTQTEPTVTTTPEEVTTTTTAETTKPKVTTTTKKPTTTTAKKTTTTTTTTKRVEEVLIPMYAKGNVFEVFSRPYNSYKYEVDYIGGGEKVQVVKGSEVLEEKYGYNTMVKIYYDNGKSGYVVDYALTDCPISQYAKKHAQLINEHRAELGLNTLAIDEKLTAAAQKRAEEVASYPSHTRPDGTMCWTVLDEFGIESSTRGEILTIADDYSLAPWESPEHYAIMTSEKYDTMGVGVVYENAELWIVVMFIS